MSYLLDTCIVSKLRKIKKYPDKKLENWASSHHETSYFISVLTIGEIQSGINKLDLKKPSERQKRLVLEDWLFEELVPRFNNRILAIDTESALVYGKLVGECQKRGIVVPVIDSLIAATALAHSLTVVTENINDFLETGVRLFSPWVD